MSRMPRVRAEPARLSSRQKEIAAAYYVEHMTHQQISDTFGISTGTVRPTLRYVARKLGETSYGRDNGELMSLLCEREDICPEDC